jgi:unsaturated rhamnogalacturonyl hydrolase
MNSESTTDNLKTGIFRIQFKNLQVLFLCLLLSFGSCQNTVRNPGEPVVFVVRYDPDNPENKNIAVRLSWKEVIKQYGERNYTHVKIRDLNNESVYTPDFYDSDADSEPDFMVFHIATDAEEPLRPFEIIVENNCNSKQISNKENILQNPAVSVTFLTPARYITGKGESNEKFSVILAESIIETYPDPSDLEIYAPGKWTYTNGFFNNALCELTLHTGNQEYCQYAQDWLDIFITENNKIDTNKYHKNNYRLDDILPGRSLLFVYERTGDKKYLEAADDLIDQLKHQPLTSEGGYWHKKIYEWQMWLDGIYMSDVFVLQYARLLEKPELIDEALKQLLLIYHHTLDPETGLLYHGWDESKNKVWADQIKGTSSEFWGRAIGWYMMALVDALDYIPEHHPERDSIVTIFKNLSASIAGYQDFSAGLWYQVVNKADEPGNWIETSCSAMFAYAFAKGFKEGYLNRSYLEKADKAYNGLINNYVYFDDAGKIYLTKTVKVGTLNFNYSDGSYEYYISVDRRLNDFKGLSALLYLAMTLEKEIKQ